MQPARAVQQRERLCNICGKVNEDIPRRRNVSIILHSLFLIASTWRPALLACGSDARRESQSAPHAVPMRRPRLLLTSR